MAAPEPGDMRAGYTGLIVAAVLLFTLLATITLRPTLRPTYLVASGALFSLA